MDLSDCVAVVTGASQGLGRVMARGLAGAGARVVLVSPDGERLHAVAHEIGLASAHPVQADITSQADCRRIVDEALGRFGSIGVLVNNARHTPPQERLPFWQSPVELWEASTRVNVFGTYLMTRTCVPAMIDAQWGRVINLTTSLDTIGRRFNSPYGVTKAAIEVETIIWAQDLAGTGVTVNSLLPGGACDTRAERSRGPVRGGALLDPEIMVPPLVWLASRASDGMTGGRYIAKHWSASAPLATAIANSSSAPILRSGARA